MFWQRSQPPRIATLPPRGRAVILSDLHGSQPDWEAFLERSRILERIRGGEDAYLLITGDVPDVARHQSLDPRVPEDGDVTILEQLMRCKRELGERGERIVYLEGNHDFHVARIAREITRYHAGQRGQRIPGYEHPPRFTTEERDAYFSYYKQTYGEPIFNNNIAPYDMIYRLRPEHVSFLEASPVLAVCREAGLLVTHAGPPRMASRKPKGLRREIERASREYLRKAPPEAYYESVYHQLLNNRYRNRDYDLGDVATFVEAFGCGLLVTGHTPHPYLVDFQRQAPLEGCSFRDGLGLIGDHQVVLCSSFGAFHPSLKRYLELDLSRRYDGVEDLLEDAAETVRPVDTASERPDPQSLPGAEFILG